MPHVFCRDVTAVSTLTVFRNAIEASEGFYLNMWKICLHTSPQTLFYIQVIWGSGWKCEGEFVKTCKAYKYTLCSCMSIDHCIPPEPHRRRWLVRQIMAILQGLKEEPHVTTHKVDTSETLQRIHILLTSTSEMSTLISDWCMNTAWLIGCIMFVKLFWT